MCAKAALRLSIVAEWLLVVLSIVLSELLADRLPQQLRDYLEWEVSRELTSWEGVLLILALLGLGLVLVASVALFRFRRWGLWLYLAASVALYALSPFTGPVVSHPLSAIVDDLSSAASGLVVGIAFFGGAFRATPAVTPSSAARAAAAD